MKNIRFLFLAVITLIFIQGCEKDETVVPPASTVPSFTYVVDNDGIAPATVTFTNTTIVPDDVGTVTYYWNFGDGQSFTGENATHYYETPGAYTVNLVAVTSVSLEIKEYKTTIIIKDPAASGTPIYFTDGSAVYRALINSAAPVFEQLPVSGIQDSYGMIADTVHDKLYITDFDAGTIIQTNLDGTGQIVFRSGLDSPDGIAIDYQENKIYWDTPSGIQRADLSVSDVTQKEDFITGQSNDPDGLCIDHASRTLFWNNYNGGVGRKKLDGTGEMLIIPGTGGGGSIIMVGDRILYDDYFGSGDIRLQYANTDGSGISLLAAGITRVVYGLNYDAFEQKVYWGDRNNGTIMRANADGSDAEPWYVASGSSPRGITFGKHF